MAEWKEIVLKGGSIADLGMVGAAEGDLLVAGGTPFTFAGLTKGTSGKYLKAGATTLSWEDAAIAKVEDIGDVEAYTGNANKLLAVNAGGNDVEWVVAGAGDFKADGSVAMTDALKLVSNAGEGGMTTTDGAIFFDTTADKVKVYVA